MARCLSVKSMAAMSLNLTGSVSESGNEISCGCMAAGVRLNTEVDFVWVGGVAVGRESTLVLGGSSWHVSRMQVPSGPRRKDAARAVVPVPTFSDAMSLGLASIRVSPCLREDGRNEKSALQ